MKWLTFTFAIATFGALGATLAIADQAADEAEIRSAVKAYVEAYNAGDAKALAGMWSPEAVYTNPLSGEQVVGQEAIQEQFTAIFEQAKGVKLAATTRSVDFISPGVAVEFGAASVIRPDQDPEESNYSAVYVKRDGRWLLDRVTEETTLTVVSNYDQLKELEWMIGVWVDRDDHATIETTCQWTKNRNFMTRMFTITVGEQIAVSGMQLIGWDPAAKQIRSWVFDSDGGFGDGKWTKKDNAWHIQSSGTSPDGSRSSAVNIITRLDNDTCTWQSVNRMADGELLPNVDEVIVARKNSED